MSAIGEPLTGEDLLRAELETGFSRMDENLFVTDLAALITSWLINGGGVWAGRKLTGFGAAAQRASKEAKELNVPYHMRPGALGGAYGNSFASDVSHNQSVPFHAVTDAAGVPVARGAAAKTSRNAQSARERMLAPPQSGTVTSSWGAGVDDVTTLCDMKSKPQPCAEIPYLNFVAHVGKPNFVPSQDKTVPVAGQDIYGLIESGKPVRETCDWDSVRTTMIAGGVDSTNMPHFKKLLDQLAASAAEVRIRLFPSRKPKYAVFVWRVLETGVSGTGLKRPRTLDSFVLPPPPLRLVPAADPPTVPAEALSNAK